MHRHIVGTSWHSVKLQPLMQQGADLSCIGVPTTVRLAYAPTRNVQCLRHRGRLQVDVHIPSAAISAIVRSTSHTSDDTHQPHDDDERRPPRRSHWPQLTAHHGPMMTMSR